MQGSEREKHAPCTCRLYNVRMVRQEPRAKIATAQQDRNAVHTGGKEKTEQKNKTPQPTRTPHQAKSL